jgi:hypothetical protein
VIADGMMLLVLVMMVRMLVMMVRLVLLVLLCLCCCSGAAVLLYMLCWCFYKFVVVCRCFVFLVSVFVSHWYINSTIVTVQSVLKQIPISYKFTTNRSKLCGQTIILKLVKALSRSERENVACVACVGALSTKTKSN